MFGAKTQAEPVAEVTTDPGSTAPPGPDLPTRSLVVHVAHRWYSWAGLGLTIAAAYLAANGTLTAHHEDTAAVNQIVDLVRQHGGQLISVMPQRRRLEDIFVETVGIEGRRIGSMSGTSQVSSAGVNE